MVYVITDKRLSLTNRLQVHREIAVAASGLVDGGVYLWGDVKTPGNLDTFLNGDNANFPNFVGFDRYAVESRGQSCHRYYATAAEIIVKLGG
jgi:hypothetical protein